ncbi:MAG TPA: hypothetical protein PK079_24765 [Leptospiraceae bacterium]|nr:hypothetical protein [Leptospiraceae bacterium]HMW04531.1 hypothetical protein [Leptospiraceae bacterium]HMX31189.1 hypothetical protein [Leptospiraceae bacterium]HMY30717.1 hypothetical protein [Leptospiraceae bacterium]HMZ63214.1 hypothetical protein [Leptospiraceae bacterium]
MKNFFLLLAIALILSNTNCKNKKEAELNDPEWRKESMEIAQEICKKLSSCISKEYSILKKGLQTYAMSEIAPEKCADKNKKSRVYLLKGNDPQFIKETTRDCYYQIQKFSCEEIVSGSIRKSKSCQMMKSIQQESL